MKKNPVVLFLALVFAVAAATIAIVVAAHRSTEVKAQTANVSVSPVIYKNIEYGFTFTLPATWKGYTIVPTIWEGVDSQTGNTVASGPIISIRHPLWTSQNPRQDIPIMIFTIAQWNSLQNGDFHIGAAPINPSELGRNSKYVFALPARYNFSFLTGFEEVEKILAGNPLQPMEVNK